MSDPIPFRLVERAPQGRFVCPWCGASFEQRFRAPKGSLGSATVHSLEDHFADSPQCSSNKGVNNPTQDKYRDGSEDD